MESHYDILGIPPEASAQEVKSAFRKQAKRLHPDTAKASGEVATRSRDAAMRRLLESYRMLADPERRRAYDRSMRRRAAEEGGFDYRLFLKARPNDPEALAKLVVYDLLHNLDSEAIEVFERARTFEDFRLERYLERAEAMDAEFCLAEEYEKRERWLKAYTLYKRLIAMELEKPSFRYFFEVVLLRFRTLLLLKLPKALDDERITLIGSRSPSTWACPGGRPPRFSARKQKSTSGAGRRARPSRPWGEPQSSSPGLPA